MRLLHQRHHHDREGIPRQKPESLRAADTASHGGRAVPVRREYADVERDPKVRGGGSAMKSRREFLKTSGALIVGFSATGLIAKFGESQGINGTPGNQLDSWIAIGADGNVTAYTGKCELGPGLYTGHSQL